MRPWPVGPPGAAGPATRALDEEPDPQRTCFERDRDRIVHSTAFRRLAGKTQVLVFPTDHQRTRLTHALEVAQVATAIAPGVGLNVALTEAIALGHDCGHGPGGHASEDAFDVFLPGATTTPWGCRRRADRAQPVRARPSTASATTPGRARPRPPSRARSSAGPTGSPTAPTTWRTPLSAGIVDLDDLPAVGADPSSASGAQLLDLHRRAHRRTAPPASWAWTPARGRSAGGLRRVQLRAHLPPPGVGGTGPRR